MMNSKSDKLSVFVYSNTHEKIEPNSWMFMEDFHKNIVDIYGSKKEVVSCKLEPPNPKFQKMLSDLFPSHNYRNNEDFNRVILEAIHLIAQHLVSHSYILFELVKHKNNEETINYKLEIVYGNEVKIRRNNAIQIIYEVTGDNCKTLKKIKIPIKKCFLVEFPKSLGGKEKYLKFINDFKEFGLQAPMLKFSGNSFVRQAGYDLSEHQRLHELAFWKKSKIYNWHHREYGEKLFSGYYHIYRHLQFRKSKIVLRDYIIVQLKEIISKLSEEFGSKTELIIDGLITSKQIDEVIDQWNTGEVKQARIIEVL